MKYLVVFLALFLWGCATSPTGRNQLIVFNEGSIAPMAAQSFEKMKAEGKVSRNAVLNRYVDCVVSPLVEQAKSRYQFLPQSWEIVVFESDDINAFAMPGGKIGVYTGIIRLTETADQLAAVMGHEVGHVIARHAAERMSSAQLTALAVTATGVVLAENKNQRAILAALGLGAQVGILLPFSRLHESEADDIGQDLMARAGFDPQHAIRLWQLMGAQGGGRSAAILSTHPDPNARANRLAQNLAKTQPLYLQAPHKPQCVRPAF